MDLLILKLVLTPLLIGVATLAARKWGAGVGGWLAGLPLTSGPVSVFLALEQGEAFAARAAVGTLFGLIGVAAFCVGYSWMAPTQNWLASLAAGLAGFFLVSWLFRAGAATAELAFAVVCFCLLAALLLVPRPELPPQTGAPPRWDLPLRMTAATAMVLLLTGLAEALGPRMSGLLSPFPVFAGIMGVFAHRLQGPGSARLLLRGVLVGSFAFAAFFLVVGLLVTRWGLPGTYALASGLAVGVNGVLLLLLVRPRAA